MNTFGTPDFGHFRFALVCVLLTAATLLAISSPRAGADSGPSIRPVKVIKIANNSTAMTRTFFGRVSARQTVDLAFQVAGQMVEFPVIEGEIIRSGGLVARLDQEPFQLALDRAIASREKSERDLARLERLKANASQAQVDEAQTALVLADLAVRDARLAMARTTLNTPFNALVASRIAANYSTVGVGTPVARLHDMSELHVEIEVPEVLVQQIGENPNVELTARFPASDRDFPLEFREVVAEASRIGQTFTVTFGMAPPDELLLLPGATATVRATLLDRETGIIVPPQAIRTAANGDVSVMRLDATENGIKVSSVPVQIRINDNGEIQITGGLKAGDEIVAAGVNSLKDGEAVRRFTSF